MHPRDMILKERGAAELSSADFEFALDWYRRGVLAEREACAKKLCDEQAIEGKANDTNQ